MTEINSYRTCCQKSKHLLSLNISWVSRGWDAYKPGEGWKSFYCVSCCEGPVATSHSLAAQQPVMFWKGARGHWAFLTLGVSGGILLSLPLLLGMAISQKDGPCSPDGEVLVLLFVLNMPLWANCYLFQTYAWKLLCFLRWYQGHVVERAHRGSGNISCATLQLLVDVLPHLSCGSVPDV